MPAKTAPLPAATGTSKLSDCFLQQLRLGIWAIRGPPDQVARYRGRLSGPFLDRLDLQIEVPVIAPAALAAAPDGEKSALVAQPARGRGARQGAGTAGSAMRSWRRRIWISTPAPIRPPWPCCRNRQRACPGRAAV